MMNSFRRNESRRRLWAATALVIFLFLVDIFSGGRIRAEVRALGSTFSRWGNAVASSITGSGFFSSRASLAAQNQSLRDELSQYQEEAAARTATEQENAQLRDLVHLAQAVPGITAPIVSSVSASPYGTFLIGAGEAEGIVRGEVVLTASGFVVGRVSDTASHTAMVSEILAPGAALYAVIGASTVSLQGEGGGNGHANAPRALSIHTGDPVTAPEFGARPIGVVGEVASSSASASQDIYVRIPVNLESLQFVYVVASR